ncbi:MAG TPA: hypothetical protein VHB21_20155 [Minicystis sp.]|nr:hypothetical protein [Minicystis sp.]
MKKANNVAALGFIFAAVLSTALAGCVSRTTVRPVPVRGSVTVR